MKKGLAILGFGAAVPVWSKLLFHDAGLGEVATGSLEVMTQMFGLASAGAGGSIIAVHGDKLATDNEVISVPFQITSDTRRILELEQASRSQARWIKILCLLIGLVAMGLFLNLLRRRKFEGRCNAGLQSACITPSCISPSTGLANH